MQQSDHPNHVSTRRFAELMGVGARKVQQWQTAGMPVISRGRKGVSSIIDVPVAIRWLIDREVQLAIEERAKDAGIDGDYDAQQLRLLKLRADEKELVIAEKENRLAPLAEFEQTMRGAMVAIRGVIMDLPGRLAADLEQANSRAVIRDLLMDEFTRALNEAANLVENYCRIAESREHPEAADEDDTVDVGGDEAESAKGKRGAGPVPEQSQPVDTGDNGARDKPDAHHGGYGMRFAGGQD